MAVPLIQSFAAIKTEHEAGFATNKIDGKFATIAINIQIADCSKKYIVACTTSAAARPSPPRRCRCRAGDAEWRDPLRFALMHYTTATTIKGN